MNVNAISINTTGYAPTASRSLMIALWVARLAVAGILGMMAFVKFFDYTPEGSMVLAQALGVGRIGVTLIGLFEITTVALILIPRTRAVGALMGVKAMVGALAAHALFIGWGGNAVADMWPLALAVLGASSFALFNWRRELPIVGDRS